MWLKIESKYDGPLSWTEYTDFDGKVYIIYDLISEPGFENAILKNEEDKEV